MEKITMLKVNSRSVGLGLFSVALILAVVHVITMLLWFGDYLPFDDWWRIAIFDLDEEESVGTWFSAVILLLAAQLLLLQAYGVRIVGVRWWKWWAFLSVGFHILSVDEIAGFHEYLNSALEQARWTTFAAPLVLVVGALFIPFLKALPSRTRWLFIIAGLIYVGGAIGVERGTDWYYDNDLLNTLEYNLWTAVEEFMEMSGVILFIYALLDYRSRADESSNVQINFQ
jgi:hypothetical protein